MSRKAWSFLVIAGRRQYAGNAGYEDDPAELYRYDSAVGNSGRVAPGDLVALRDRHSMVGVAIIDTIRDEAGSKERFRCPECRTTALKERQHTQPRYRCDRGHEFELPVREMAAVTRYEASYGRTFLRLGGEISAAVLRSLVFRPSSQNSIEEIDASALASHVLAVRPEAGLIFESFFQELDADDLPEERDPPYTPSMADRRKRILRAIRQRRGQAKFRKSLLERYGGCCMISGCVVADVIEAAHIWPYRGDEDNSVLNGLLLKSDLHTLYDLDLLGIEPGTLKIKLSDRLRGTEYQELEGQTLRTGRRFRPSDEAIELRWAAFCKKTSRRFRSDPALI